ncbi:hypothetical protein [Hoyosella altamirensis]|uniref:Membrane protein implicated in regulation of membrane protease activity n=1 Tax=Hoyosella altamirensis TaxID=616997 RepID=A0A839RRV8_9ACTN|nr:hypothetical protein [Hoyosella altamirensis]MBB3038834.1 membrane protein implicated in regulation of membrane protease activity [Hoyosella altamirensis]
MLAAALVATIVGFAFLVAALLTGNLLWAWICIGICVAGIAGLIFDAVRPARGSVEDEDASGTR